MTATTKTQRPSIVQVRRAIDSLVWSINDLHGHTADEFGKRDVPAVLGAKIAYAQALIPQIPGRFQVDIDGLKRAIQSADRMIGRWKTASRRTAAND